MRETGHGIPRLLCSPEPLSMAGGTEVLVASLDRNGKVVRDKGWQKRDGSEGTG